MSIILERVNKNKRNVHRYSDPFELIRLYSKKHYTSMVKQGYKWHSNVSLNDIKKTEIELKSRGLEVYIGLAAFNSKGGIIKGLRAIFTKKE